MMNTIFTAILLVSIGASGCSAVVARRLSSVDKYCKGSVGQFAYAPGVQFNRHFLAENLAQNQAKDC